MGRGPLDHLPDVGGTTLRTSASSPALPGGGGGDALGSVTARPEVEADTPEVRVLEKRAVSPVVSTIEVEWAAVGATQPPPQRVERAPESGEDWPAPVDIEAVPPSPPSPLQRRVAVPKRLYPRLSRKRHVEVPTLAPRKALKVSSGSTAQCVTEVQTAIQRGVASARADPKELGAQGEAVEVAMEQVEEEEPTPREAEARKLAGAEAPLVTEATEAEAPRASEAEATEAGVPRTTEVVVAEAGALGTIKVEAAEASMSAMKLAAQEVETEVGQASILPPVQGPPLS
ncbi:uncharacterized protein [Miscanthus floridulus]|uniref:uncharacterized protein n=1 Tax=Miscanthus floridulus TaxID=154761 RepID=UPI003457DCA1